MRHMFSLKQIIKLIQQYAPEITPEEIQAMFNDGDVSLAGKYVRVVNASDITEPLTEEMVATFNEGCFINGIYKEYKNPIIYPSDEPSTHYIFGVQGSGIARLATFVINEETGGTSGIQTAIYLNGKNVDIPFLRNINDKTFPSYSKGFFYYDGNALKWYSPVSQDNITSGDTIALDSNLGKALIDHLDVEINGHRCRYERTNGNYVVYSWKDEADSGVNLEVNMISYNTTNGTLSFNIMKFAPIV